MKNKKNFDTIYPPLSNREIYNYIRRNIGRDFSYSYVLNYPKPFNRRKIKNLLHRVNYGMGEKSTIKKCYKRFQYKFLMDVIRNVRNIHTNIKKG